MVSTSHRNICTNCRKVGFHAECLVCGKATILVGSRWRAPKRTNDRAWKRIASGDIMWDHKAIDKKERIKATKRNAMMERWRKAIAARKINSR